MEGTHGDDGPPSITTHTYTCTTLLKWADSSFGCRRAWNICASTACRRTVYVSAFQEPCCLQHVEYCEYKMQCHFSIFHFTELSALHPLRVWIRNVLWYPETQLPLKGSISENACIGPVGAEFRWGWRESIISSISLFSHFYIISMKHMHLKALLRDWMWRM